MTDQKRELLERYSPVIQYDSMEGYSADSVATMTDCATAENPHGNVLRHAGAEIAAVSPTLGEAKLDLEFLRGDQYPDPDHTAVTEEDFIDVVGQEYLAEAHAMHLRPGMANQIYGHAVTDSEGHLWLQYWFFYYYNDKAMLGMGLHEGDWEMIQLRTDADGAPDVATYAQHTHGEWCLWRDIEKEDGAPVVYSARGSHASYYRPGLYPQAPVVPDHNDDRGPRVRPSLTVIKGEDPLWPAWPGRWGSTRNHGKILGFEIGADSPPGPHGHGSWHDPLRFHREARPAVGLTPVAGADLPRPAAPTVGAERDGDRARVSFSFSAADPAAPKRRGILVSLDGAKDGHAPVTQSFATDEAEGQIEFPLDLEDRAYTVRVGGVGENGVTGPAGESELPAG